MVVEGLPGDDNQQQTADDVAQAVRLARQVGPSLKSPCSLVHDIAVNSILSCMMLKICCAQSKQPECVQQPHSRLLMPVLFVAQSDILYT